MMKKVVTLELTSIQLESICGGAKKKSTNTWWFWMFPTIR